MTDPVEKMLRRSAFEFDQMPSWLQRVRKVLGTAVDELARLRTELTAAREETVNLRHELTKAERWISDLQAGCYINCVYCGHRYGPDPGTPVAMAQVLFKHIKVCPKHPLEAALKEINKDSREEA